MKGLLKSGNVQKGSSMEKIKCPFRKINSFHSVGLTGEGYPVEWREYTEFDDCIGEECAAFAKDGYCKLCNQNINQFSEEFLLKLP